MKRIEWRFKRTTKTAHAFGECESVSLCGRMFAANGRITVGRTHRCKWCEVEVSNLMGVAHGGDRNNSEVGVGDGGGSDRETCEAG
jgi:hypothetical protein